MMRKIFLLFACFCLLHTTFAQIHLEHSYDFGSGYAFCTFIDFTYSGEKYIWYQQTDEVLDINMYNLDHSLFKNISLDVSNHIPVQFNSIANNYIVNISDNIFDTDEGIEILIQVVVDTLDWDFVGYLLILNEDDSEVLIIDEVNLNYALETNLVENERITAYNTSEGLKMMVKKAAPIIEVYSLPGALPNDVSLINDDLISLHIYPNPTSEYSVIEYTLAENEKNATLYLFDQSGVQILNQELYENKGKINISTYNLKSGLYTYVITSKGDSVLTSKMIVVR